MILTHVDRCPPPPTPRSLDEQDLAFSLKTISSASWTLFFFFDSILECDGLHSFPDVLTRLSVSGWTGSFIQLWTQLLVGSPTWIGLESHHQAPSQGFQIRLCGQRGQNYTDQWVGL